MSDALATRNYIAMLDDSATLPADSLAFVRNVPADYADTRTWVRYATQLDSTHQWQLRRTQIDNAPIGREVHWSSAFAHLVRIADRISHAVSGLPLARATEQALAWFNLPLLLLVIIAASSWVAARLGIALGVTTAFALAGYRWFYEGFAPNNVDHHGLLAAACLGVVLGAVFMAGGFVRDYDAHGEQLLATPAQAKRAAIVSALSGVAGLWISAASVLPTVFFVGLAGVALAWWADRGDRFENVKFDPALWRLWGRVGCVGALIVYALEYAPSNLQLRLEVNHPLYAFAWLGGGEFIALVATRDVRRRAARMLLAATLVALPAIATAFAGAGVFAMLDPTLAAMHATIGEFQSLPNALHILGPGAVWRYVPGFLLLLSVAALPLATRTERIPLALASAVAIPLVAMACWQVRWWLTASGAEITLVIVALAIVVRRWPRMQYGFALAVSILFLSALVGRAALTRRNVSEGVVSIEDALQPMYRDAAVVLRRTDADERVVLLASPNASNAIGYFGSFSTVASLYWENAAGVKAAADIFSAPTDDEAYALVRARAITHVVMVSADNFLAEYSRISGKEGATSSFGARLLAGTDTASWLQPIPFHPRLPEQNQRVMLFHVVLPQTPFELAWNYATAAVASTDDDIAENDFHRAIALRTPTNQPLLWVSAGGIAYQWKRYALAIRLFESGAHLGQTPDAEANIAWILATSADDAVRNGPLALARAKALAAKYPTNETVLDVLAAAMAENGLFDDAASIERQLLSIAQTRRDAQAVDRARLRYSAYAARKAWRQ